ncbi:MAG: FAD-binding protein [Gemmatimonadota bacterium]
MIAETLHWAHVAGRKLRVRGAGRWSNAGRPVHADETLSLAEHRGIVEYVPGDLTMTVRAGTTLAEIGMATSREGQWLPLDPWGSDDGTVGATLSTATTGPFSHAMGLPRDLVLGMEFVTGDGQTVRSGGRVVKNVAGFDLTRLMVGSWGTLGVITEVTVRLRSRPEHRETIAVALTPTRTGLNELAARLRALPFAPLASELVNTQLAARLGFGDVTVLLVALGGNERAVRAQRAAIGGFGDCVLVDEAVWPALRSSEREPVGSWRWSQLPSQFGDTWTAADTGARVLESFHLHGNPARGVVRVVAHGGEAQASALVRAATAFNGTVNVESLPMDAWPLVSPSAPSALSRGIRDKFDPARILNDGILGSDE